MQTDKASSPPSLLTVLEREAKGKEAEDQSYRAEKGSAETGAAVACAPGS